MLYPSLVKRLVLPIVLWCGINQVTFGQQQVSIIEVLMQLETDHKVSFSYNTRLLENLSVDHLSKPEDLTASLEELSKSVPIKFENPGTDYYSIIPVRSNVSFEVMDKQTGEPIPSVLVQVGSKDFAYLFPTPTKFTLREAFVTDTVHLSSRFYTTAKLAIGDLVGLNHKVWLDQDTLYLENVTVRSYTISGINANIETQNVEVDMSDLGLIAGETDGDILQVLKTIPGIRSPTGKAGALIMRGSTYDQNLMYFDHIPLYHTGHYFGTISPYNQAVVDRIEVHRGSLPAKWGGKVGGLIDIQTKSAIPKKISGGALANTIFAGGHINSPIVKDKLSLFLSARTNYPSYSSSKMDAYSKLSLQGSKAEPSHIGQNNELDRFDVKFNDLNGKLIFKPSEKHEITYSVLRIIDDFGFTITTPSQNLTEEEDSQLVNWGMTTEWNGELSAKWKVSVKATNSFFEIDEARSAIESGSEISNKQAENSIRDHRVGVDLGYQLNEGMDFNFGYSLVNQQVLFDEVEIEDGMVRDKHTDDTGLTHSVYLSAKRHLGSKLILDGGLHVDHFSLTDDLFLDPRMMVSFFLSKNVYLKASGGRAHQYLFRHYLNDFDDFRLANQFWSLAGRNQRVQAGTQFMVGGMIDESGWLIDLELYQKNTDGIERQLDPSIRETGSLHTIGMDVLVKKRFEAFDLWSSYTLSRSETSFSQIENAYFDQTHVLNLMLLIPRERWNVSLSWGLMSGMPVDIPTNIKSMNSGQPANLVVPYEDRFPTQHQLDLSATYQFSKPAASWKGVLGISFLNLYDNQNLINIFQNDVTEDNPYRYGIGFSPNLQLSISW